jgi:hypothetical protein
MSNRPGEPRLTSPWAEFLTEVDRQLPRGVELHCLGGFVLLVLHGLPRPTGDLDYISIIPRAEAPVLVDLAGRDSPLARKHGVWFQHVTVADYPDDYESRLTAIAPGRFSRLRLMALEPHDIALAKLTRNHPVDAEDVRFLVRRGIVRPSVLRERYEKELRPHLVNEERHDTTLKLWLSYFEA